MSESATAEPNRLVAASVGVAIPRDRSLFGYLSEHHAYGQTAKTAADYAEDLAAEMLATILGVEFNPNSSWDEKREIWKIADVIYKTKEVTQTAVGHKDGLWTTVVAAAILLRVTSSVRVAGRTVVPDRPIARGSLRMGYPGKRSVSIASHRRTVTGRDGRRPDRPRLPRATTPGGCARSAGSSPASCSSPTAPSG